MKGEIRGELIKELNALPFLISLVSAFIAPDLESFIAFFIYSFNIHLFTAFFIDDWRRKRADTFGCFRLTEHIRFYINYFIFEVIGLAVLYLTGYAVKHINLSSLGESILLGIEVVGLFILFGIVSIKTIRKLIAEEEEEIRQRIRQRMEEERRMRERMIEASRRQSEQIRDEISLPELENIDEDNDLPPQSNLDDDEDFSFPRPPSPKEFRRRSWRRLL
jgi:uncharacterized protein YhbP (UPF0306 family)